ncbi:MAG: homocysteine S-methyltransferase family protein [Chloroflexota bacterium]
MPIDIRKRLQDTNEVLVYCLSMHTLLSYWGKDMEDHLSYWVITHPEEFKDCVRQCVANGGDLVSVGTQAASPWRAETFGLRDKVYEMNYKSAKLAKEAIPAGRYVVGFVSMTNPDFLEPVGNMTYDEVYEGYKLQISALLEGGADMIWVSGNHIDEGLIAVKVAKDLADIAVGMSNVYYMGKKGFRTMVGVDPQTASARAQAAGVDIIGFNCGLMTKDSRDPQEWYRGAVDLVKQIKQGTDRPAAAMPDPCLPELIDGQTVWAATPDDLARAVPDLIEAGARLIGGCCGTNLEHYRKVSEVLGERGVKASY